MIVKGYHAHFYYDANEVDAVNKICMAAQTQLGVHMGRPHTGPVGPHPRGNCQLSFSADMLNDVLPWLMKNRDGYTVFMHGLSGDDYVDHTQLIFWLGDSETLDLSIFKENQNQIRA